MTTTATANTTPASTPWLMGHTPAAVKARVAIVVAGSSAVTTASLWASTLLAR